MNQPVKQMIARSPAVAAEIAAHSGNFTLSRSGVLNIYYDLTDEDLESIAQASRVSLIQFTRGRLNEHTLKLINKRILTVGNYTGLRVVLNGCGAFHTLDFLTHLSNLKNLTVELFKSKEVEKINEFLQLETLSISAPGISIKDIVRQTSLKELTIAEKPKNIEAIGSMDWIEKLTLANQTLKSLDFLTPLNNLAELGFRLGGTRNLAALPDIGRIERLSFAYIRQLTIENLLPINDMKYIKHLLFDQQPHLTDLNWLKNKSIKTTVTSCKSFTG